MAEHTDVGRPVRVGDVLFLRDADYRYGAGDLRLRVTVAPVESPEPGLMVVTGVPVRPRGRDGVERRVYVVAEVLQSPRVRGSR
ncbi:hypothetical protein ACQP00_20305 [Dactylosporangium sp. CS-047395]|uniref:hypothetical protein n=1 Tax=Dactylosporangium sp. CS-047395 TaxID=3239936 RepID=UPI003D8E2D76